MYTCIYIYIHVYTYICIHSKAEGDGGNGDEKNFKKASCDNDANDRFQWMDRWIREREERK